MLLANNTVFWCSLGSLAYTYLGYPAAIVLMSKLRPRDTRKAPIEPTMSVVVAVRDGAEYIEDKIRNLLAMSYPKEKLEIIVVSDASTDGTDPIVSSFRDQGIVFERLGKPAGKPAALNRGVALATGDIVVFCDARQRIDPGALRALAAHFADPEVGAVSGELFIDHEKGPGIYWKYEKLIRAAEAAVDSVPGATGALYAIRRKLFVKLPNEVLLDDVYTPLQILLRGYRVVFESGAKVFDIESDLDTEWRRKARTLAGNFQLVQHLPSLLNPFKNRIFWQFTSHKLMRLSSPFALGGLFVSNVALVAAGSAGWPLYAGFLGAQCLGYHLALRGAFYKEKAGKLSRAACTFVLLNAAALEGAKRYLKRDFSWT